jgi:hypothetical protein
MPQKTISNQYKFSAYFKVKRCRVKAPLYKYYLDCSSIAAEKQEYNKTHFLLLFNII